MNVLFSLSDSLSLEQYADVSAYLDGLKKILLPAHVEVICDTKQQTKRMISVLAQGHVPESVVMWVDSLWWNEEAPRLLQHVPFQKLTLLPLRIRDMVTIKPWKPRRTTAFTSGFYESALVEGNTVHLINESRDPKQLPVINALQPVNVRTTGPFVDYKNIKSDEVHVSEGVLGQDDLEQVLSRQRISILDTDVLTDVLFDVHCECLAISPNVLGTINRIKCDVLTIVLEEDLAELRRIARNKVYAQVWELRLEGTIGADQQSELLGLTSEIFGIRTCVDPSAMTIVKRVLHVTD